MQTTSPGHDIPVGPDTAPGHDTDRFGGVDFALYAATVFAWSTSWLALSWQVGAVDPQVSVFWRFAFAAVLMLGICAATGRRLRFPWRMHLRFAGMGVLLFSTNFMLFYYAASGLVSGLLSVIFSTASVTNILMNTIVLRRPLRSRVVLGAGLGIIGIAYMFWPEIGSQPVGGPAMTGLALGVAGTLCFSAGNMISASNQKLGIPVFSANAIGMVYGALNCLVISLVAGSEFTIDGTWKYVGSLLWLVGVSTVMAFCVYLTLLGRIGADRAGYATVVFPAFALIISTFVEGYQWTALSLYGLVLVAIGNVIILSRPKPRVKPRQPML